ncbi:MAG: hypothetical protein OHK0029_34530 [Armatimonadaceae bacterium]
MVLQDEKVTFSGRCFSPQEVEILCQAIAHRRSMGIARLKPDPVPREMVEKALEAANWAPNHGETEPWRFTVFTGDSRGPLGEAFAEAYRIATEEREETVQPRAYEAHRLKVWSAPVWVSIGMTPAQLADGSLKMTEEEEHLAVGCAVQNFHLVVAAMGLGGMWLSNFTMTHPHVAQFLGLEPPSRLMGFFPLGYPQIECPLGERTPLKSKVRWAEDDHR